MLPVGCGNISVWGGYLIPAARARLVGARWGYAAGRARVGPSATVYETLSGMISQAIAKTDALEEKIEGGTSGGTPVTVADETLYIN